MIQNLIIIKDGTTLLNDNFGNCHSLNSNPILLSAFFEALISFSEEFEQGTLEQLKFENTNVNFLKSNGLLYILVSDTSDRMQTIRSKLKKIARLFNEKFGNTVKDFTGEITSFSQFKNTLLELEIAQKNCGKHSECSEYPDKENNSSILDQIIKTEKLY
ncbi:MAG: hypothetical protein HZR80_16140 [Candidatus Heimdallarchaeota archaeon]